MSDDTRMYVEEWLSKSETRIAIEQVGGNPFIGEDNPAQMQGQHFAFTIIRNGREVHWHIQTKHNFSAMIALNYIADIMVVYLLTSSFEEYCREARGLITCIDPDILRIHYERLAIRDRELTRVLGEWYDVLLYGVRH
jgi:hypothetical protein